jgi:hypothetical protein
MNNTRVRIPPVSYSSLPPGVVVAKPVPSPWCRSLTPHLDIPPVSYSPYKSNSLSGKISPQAGQGRQGTRQSRNGLITRDRLLRARLRLEPSQWASDRGQAMSPDRIQEPGTVA